MDYLIDFVQEMRVSLTTQSNRQDESDRNALFATKAPPKPYMQEERPVSSTKFYENEQEQQQLLMRDQDRQLDTVLNTVGNLKDIASVMGRELEDQGR